MKLYLTLLALAGKPVFLIVFLMDREREAGIERLVPSASRIDRRPSSGCD
jgi:hypothetical protein